MVRDGVEGKESRSEAGALQPPTVQHCISVGSCPPHTKVWPRYQVAYYKLESIGSEIPREIMMKLPFFN